MRTFEIVSSLGRRKKPVAWFLYDESADRATIELAEDARTGHVPAMFNRYLELGDYHIDEEWTRKWMSERIPPSSRHNIDEILKHAGIPEYNPYLLLFFNGGRCSQDDFYLREIADPEAHGDAKRPKNTQSSQYEYAVLSLQEGLGSTLAKARRDAGITQQELSYRTGIRQSTLSRLERGLGNPTVETLSCIADALDLKLHITLEP